MIELTRLNGKQMVLNSDLIKTAEASPDTMLTLINGEKLIVREDLGEIVNRTLAYRAQLLSAIAQRLPAHEKDLMVMPGALERRKLSFVAFFEIDAVYFSAECGAGRRHDRSGVHRACNIALDANDHGDLP